MSDFIRLFSLFEGCDFSESQQRLISEIYPIIKKKIEEFIRETNQWPRYDEKNFASVCINKNIISTYKEKINRIAQILDSSDEKGEKFLKYFPTWKRQREKNIEKLLKTASDLKNVRHISNIARIATGTVGFGGGLIALASLLFTRQPYAAVGVIIATTGAFGTTGASITELVLTQGSLDDSKKIIANDRKLLQELGIYEFLNELSDAVNDLFGKSKSSNILIDLIEFLCKVPSILNDVRPYLPVLQECLNKLLPTVREFLVIGPPLAAVILSISFSAFMSRRRGFGILNSNVALGLVSAVNATVQVTSLIAAAGLNGSALAELIPRELAGKFGAGAMVGFGITLDVATVVLNTIELARGTLSDETKMLCAVANQLNAHLIAYQDLYCELQTLKIRRIEEMRRQRILEWLLFVTAVSILSVSLYIKIFE